MTVYCFGSINIDRVLQVPRFPVPGETLAATGYAEGLGGKGANQSVAAARAGARAVHIGRIGADGRAVLAALAGYGVDVAHVAEGAEPTGSATILVDPAAENLIVLMPGANRAQDPQAVRAALAGAQSGDTLLLQNEVSFTAEAAAMAAALGLQVIYSAAPFDAAAAQAVLSHVAVLLVNELEAAQLGRAMGRSVKDLPVPHVVVTRGAAGAVLVDTGEGSETAFPSLPVTPVDTTGAGDTFAGYLAAGLDQGLDWPAAMRLALSAAALSTTRPGAAASIPGRSEVADRLRGA